MTGQTVVIEPGTEAVTDACMGWPLKVSACISDNWNTTIELARTDPDSDETESVIDLTAEDAIRLAVQLIAVAHKVRDVERAQQAP